LDKVVSKRRLWLAGLILAAAGVGLARGASLISDELVPKLVFYLVGSLLAFAGLGLIMAGIRAGR
jgi:hypothetical protein